MEPSDYGPGMIFLLLTQAFLPPVLWTAAAIVVLTKWTRHVRVTTLAVCGLACEVLAWFSSYTFLLHLEFPHVKGALVVVGIGLIVAALLVPEPGTS